MHLLQRASARTVSVVVVVVVVVVVAVASLRAAEPLVVMTSSLF